VVEATRLFEEFNGAVLDDPRVNIVLADGRNHLALTDRKYDVIISQPSDPATAGVASLFTREFFQTCTVDREVFRSVVSSFTDVFDGTSIWSAAQLSEFLLIGSRAGAQIQLEELEARIKSPELNMDFKRLGVHDAESLSRFFVAGTESAVAFAGDAEPHVDDLPRLEFTAPRTVFSQKHPTRIIEALAGVRDGKIDWIKTDSAADEKAVAKIQKANQNYFDCRVLVHRSNLAYDNDNKSEAFALLVKASRLNPAHERILEVVKSLRRTYLAQMKAENIDAAIGVGRELIALLPNSAGDTNNLAWALATNPKSTASERADEKEGNELMHLQTMLTLTAAHRASKENREAYFVATKGIELAKQAGQTEQVKDCQAKFQKHVESLEKLISK